MAKPDIYVSVDVETDGPIPGPHSLLSLGAAAFVKGNRTPVNTFEMNFVTLPGAAPDPETAAWWAQQKPEVWAHVTKDPVAPEVGVPRFIEWVEGLQGEPVLVTYPSWDLLWVHWYILRFYGKSPFGIGGLDLKSMAFGALDFERFKAVTKRQLPKELFEGCGPHTHKALDDALGQGVLLVNLLEIWRHGRR